MPNRSLCDLWIPHKDIDASMPSSAAKVKANWLAIEQWAQRYIRECVTGGICANGEVHPNGSPSVPDDTYYNIGGEVGWVVTDSIMCDVTNNGNAMMVNTDGDYIVGGMVGWEPVAAGSRGIAITAGSSSIFDNRTAPAAIDTHSWSTSRLVTLNAGNLINMAVSVRGAGGPVTLIQEYTHLWCVRVCDCGTPVPIS